MKKGLKITLVALLVIVLVGAGVGIYMKSRKSTDEQFNDYVDASKAAGQDVFQGLSYSQLNKLNEQWKSNLTKKEAETLISLTRSAKNSAEEKRAVIESKIMPLIEKWQNRKIVS